MTLAEARPGLKALFAADSVLAAIDCLDQAIATYEADFKAALAAPGVVLVLTLADGKPADDPALEQVDLDNTLIVSVVENPVKNTTGRSIDQWLARVLAVVAAAPHGAPGPRPYRLAADQAYSAGPFRTGLAIYFVNVEVRTLDPVAA